MLNGSRSLVSNTITLYQIPTVPNTYSAQYHYTLIPSTPMTLDTHQHFWHYDPKRHAWIDDTMQSIQRDFLPADLQPILKEHDIDGCIAVQVDQTEEETHFLLKLANRHPFIAGVVGWVDLQASDVRQRLEYWSQFDHLCGFRHIVQAEEDVNFLLRPYFFDGVGALQEFGFTYDILVFPHQLGATLEFVRKLPHQPLVIDHIAKPYIADGFIDGWALLMRQISTYPNVYCKVSGMITEADWAGWTYEDFVPYLDVVFDAFGADRIMFGSDWPVCLVAGSYTRMIEIVRRYTDGFSEDEKAGVFGLNGRRFYGVP